MAAAVRALAAARSAAATAPAAGLRRMSPLVSGFNRSPPANPLPVPGCSANRFVSVLNNSIQFRLGLWHSFSSGVTPLPVITDPDIKAVFKDLMAASWDEIPEGVVYDVKNALSKTTEDKASQEALANLFRAAEASTEFGAVLVQLRMAVDDTNGIVGDNVQPVPEELFDALTVAYSRYMAYLDAFGPDETYLRKKVEIELGTKMVHLKMRCSGLGSEWGKVSVLGTSGLSGSYVEHRAR